MLLFCCPAVEMTMACLLSMFMLYKQVAEANDWYSLYDTMVDEVIYRRNRQFRLDCVT